MKHKKINLLYIFLVFGSSIIYSQNNTVSSGGEALGTGGTVSYSIGQVNYLYVEGSNGSTSQGVQQPFEIYTLGVDDFDNIDLEVIVFPNPTTSVVTLSVRLENIENTTYQLSDINGRLIINGTINSEETIIQMENLRSATYFLTISDNTKHLKTFKLIKN